jgi:hypothetical protein
MSDIGRVDESKYSKVNASGVLLKYTAVPLFAYLGGHLLSESFFEPMGQITGAVLSTSLLGISGLLISQRQSLRTFFGSVTPFVAGILGPDKTNETIIGIQATAYLGGFLVSAFTNLVSKYEKNK